MELFDKRFAHFMWEDGLEGKEGFVDENITGLKSAVNQTQAGLKTTVRKADDDIFVSNSNNRRYAFFYYDPLYECKRAYAEGKQIQHELSANVWLDCKGEPDWESDDNFRIKPEEPESRRMTYKQGAEWINRGNGCALHDCQVYYFLPKIATDAEESLFKNGWKIRRWGSDEWIEPTVDVYNADCKKEN